MGFKGYDYIEKVELTDGDGNIIDANQRKTTFYTKSNAEPAFAKFYFNDLARLMNLSKQTSNVLYELLKFMDYNNEISMSIGKKKAICSELQIYNTNHSTGEIILGTNVIDQHIGKMVKEGVLYRKDTGLYVLSPSLFGRGKWADIQNIALNIQYGFNKDGIPERTMTAKIEKDGNTPTD